MITNQLAFRVSRFQIYSSTCSVFRIDRLNLLSGSAPGTARHRVIFTRYIYRILKLRASLIHSWSRQVIWSKFVNGNDPPCLLFRFHLLQIGHACLIRLHDFINPRAPITIPHLRSEIMKRNLSGNFEFCPQMSHIPSGPSIRERNQLLSLYLKRGCAVAVLITWILAESQ